LGDIVHLLPHKGGQELRTFGPTAFVCTRRRPR
jgi:hypothetical protein